MSVDPDASVPCPVCGCPRCRFWGRLEDRFFQVTRETFPLYRCPECGLRFQRASEVADRIPGFYPPGYWWDPEGDARGVEGLYREWVLRRDQLRFVLSAAAPDNGRRLLDIGCGSGTFLKLAREAGFRVKGLEASPDAGRAAEKILPGRVMVGDERQLIRSGATFHVLTLFHVLEHLPRPLDYLRRIRRLLTEDGGLVIQVPNSHSVQAALLGARWYGLDCPRHIHNFTARALIELLRRAGFRVRRVRHFSLRDNAAALVSSLFPFLDPMSGKVRLLRETKQARSLGLSVREAVYFGLLLVAQPLAAMEAALGRGATVTVFATAE